MKREKIEGFWAGNEASTQSALAGTKMSQSVKQFCRIYLFLTLKQRIDLNHHFLLDGRHICRNKMVEVYIYIYFIYIELEWSGPVWRKIFGFHPGILNISPKSRFTLKTKMFVESYLKSEQRAENHSNISSQRLRNVLVALSSREMGNNWEILSRESSHKIPVEDRRWLGPRRLRDQRLPC